MSVLIALNLFFGIMQKHMNIHDVYSHNSVEVTGTGDVIYLSQTLSLEKSSCETVNAFPLWVSQTLRGSLSFNFDQFTSITLDTLAEPYDKIISSHPCVQGANRESGARAVNRLNWRCQLFHMLYWPKYVNAWGSICGNLQACRLNTGIALLTLKGISSLSSFSFTSFNFPTPPPLCVLDALSNAPLLDSPPPPMCLLEVIQPLMCRYLEFPLMSRSDAAFNRSFM